MAIGEVYRPSKVSTIYDMDRELRQETCFVPTCQPTDTRPDQCQRCLLDYSHKISRERLKQATVEPVEVEEGKTERRFCIEALCPGPTPDSQPQLKRFAWSKNLNGLLKDGPNDQETLSFLASLAAQMKHLTGTDVTFGPPISDRSKLETGLALRGNEDSIGLYVDINGFKDYKRILSERKFNLGIGETMEPPSDLTQAYLKLLPQLVAA